MRFWTFWRGMRPRRESDDEQLPRAAPAPDAEDEAEALDSSHIGFAPLISPLEPPYDRGAAAAGDVEQK